MPFTIRRAEAHDATQIACLLREFVAAGWFEHMKGEPAEQTESRVRRLLTQCMSDDSHSVYVAADGDSILGYASAHWIPYLFLSGPEAYVSELFVREAARGQGVGQQLLAHVKKEAQERGCSRMALINNRTRESYRRHFYERNGWTERPEMANFIYKLE